MSEIILAEKPIAGNKLKDALGIKAIPAVGHLIELKPKARKWNPPYFDLEWVARKKEVDRLNKIVLRLKEADKIYIATDYDAEGQLIAYNILRECGISPSSVLRMKFSSLESEALVSAFQKVIPFDEDFALSAEIRHKLDWYFGMNISKALTELLKEKQGIRRYYLTPVGRVQTPVLHKLVLKEKEISKFSAKDEWVVFLRGVYDTNKFFSISNYRFSTEEEVNEYASYQTEGTIDRIDEERYEHSVYPPNKDYVVKECLRQGISSNVVDFVLQDLYLDGLISYPRTTSNQYTIHGVDTQKYLERLKGVVPGVGKALGKKPREGDEVGVHPAIYPILPYTETDLKGVVWNIIAKAFVKSHLPPEVKINTVTYVNINDSLDRAFDNPDLEAGDEFSIIHKIEKRKSSPPARISEHKIYGWMVDNNLGTVDTRTQTLTKLLRTYVFQTDSGLYTSSKGVQVCDTLAKMYSDIVGVALTRRFEKLIASVQKGAKMEPILEEGRKTVTEIVKKIKENK